MEFRLQDFLIQKNLTQKKLAEYLNLSTSLVNKYAKQKCYPDYIMLCKIADYLNITTDELLGRPTNLLNKMLLTDRERNIIEKVLAMNEEQQKLTELFIDTFNKSI